MEESKEVFKSFEGKSCLVITKSNFKYHADKLKVLEDAIFFTDNRGSQIMLSFEEIKFISEDSKW